MFCSIKTAFCLYTIFCTIIEGAVYDAETSVPLHNVTSVNFIKFHSSILDTVPALLVKDNDTVNNTTIVLRPDNSDVVEAARKFLIFSVGLAIRQYYVPFIVLLGLVGNSLSFLIMQLKHNRQVACCVYMSALAIFDSGRLLMAFNIWLAFAAPDWLSHFMTTWECKISIWLIRIFTTSSNFATVAMAIDRFLAIRFPLKSVIICTAKKAKRIIIIFSFVIPIFVSPYIILAQKIKAGGCTIISKGTKTHLFQIYMWLSLCVNALIPFSLILVVNIIIILTLRKRNSTFEKYGENKEKHKKRRKRYKLGDREKHYDIDEQNQSSKHINSTNEAQLTMMLLNVAFAFVILSTPVYANIVVFTFIDFRQNPYLYAVYILTHQISSKMLITNHAINFFLYILSGPKFRKELVSLFASK